MGVVRMPGGALGTVAATKLATGAEDEMRLEVHGSSGALRFNGMDAHHLEVYDATAPSSPIGGRRGWQRLDTGQRYPAPAAAFPGPKFQIGWIRSHVACLANFLADVAAGRPGNPGLDQGLRVQRWIHCARRSADGAGWVGAGGADEVDARDPR
jgi:predicted dehydrogenase